jgi:molybdopterin/thiamine biosynthesis adenylyltransferase/proteasome lid subunit RPN8/RPN11
MSRLSRIVLLEAHRALLEQYLFDQPGVEGAAFLVCGEAIGPGLAKLICHAVVPVAAEDYLRRERDGLTIQSQALTRISKLARHERLSVVFAHSHPNRFTDFSEQDDREEERLLPFLQARLPGHAHGTLVMTREGFAGRVYAPERMPAEVMVVGARFRLFNGDVTRPISAAFDRQVRAFGSDIQRILNGLHIGIVGLGGTGSPVAEQLVRLGVGHLTLFDHDCFDSTNINRVYGATLDDVGAPKVLIAKRHLDRIGLPTQIEAIQESITKEAAALRLRGCDVIFGCTDKQIPRAILMQLALKYSLPVLDLGVLIDSKDACIQSIYGRITTLFPGEACLYCRGRISSEIMRLEALPPHERANQIREGYAPELEGPAPAVIAFTTAVASFAVAELLHRLTGFMGGERASSEILINFDQSRIRTNRVEPREACLCADDSQWGRGDEVPFLGLTWPTQPR